MEWYSQSEGVLLEYMENLQNKTYNILKNGW